MLEVSSQFLILVPIIVGLVQACKELGLTSRYAPLLSVLLGIAGAFLLGSGSNAVLQGIVAGLSAAGLWSGTKATIA